MLYRLKLALVAVVCALMILSTQASSAMDMLPAVQMTMDHGNGCDACKQSAPSSQCSNCICNQDAVAAAVVGGEPQTALVAPVALINGMVGISHRPRLRPA